LPSERHAMTVIIACLPAVMAAIGIEAAAVWICRYRYAEEKPEPESELYIVDRFSALRFNAHPLGKHFVAVELSNYHYLPVLSRKRSGIPVAHELYHRREKRDGNSRNSLAG
jgi:hypothetical protein